MIDVSKIHDISILHLYGDLSLMELEMIEQTIKSFKKYDQYKILLDMAEVDYIHFQVAQKLVKEADKLKSSEGGLKLVHTNDSAREVLQFTGADQYLEDYSSIADAVLSFLNHERDPELLT